MANTKKEYAFKGLDTRTSKLYRQEGTASDCRNVLLDSNRRLIKIKDRLQMTLARGTFGEIGDHFDKLPYDAIIIDVMKYEDHLVIATKCTDNTAGAVPVTYVNKYYKYYENVNALVYIPFQKEICTNLSHLGQTVNKVGSETDGKFSHVTMEGILYFMGGFADYDPAQVILADTIDQLAAENNLGGMFAYDGKVITRAGIADSVKDSTADVGTQPSSPQDSTDRYARLMPIKVDFKGRPTFGNYSTHLTSKAAGKESLTVNESDEFGETLIQDNAYDHACYVKVTSNSSTVQRLEEADSAAARTISATAYSRQAGYYSAAVGQYLYGVSGFYERFPSSGTPSSIFVHQEIYRCEVEAIDYFGDTVTLKNFYKYDNESGLWVKSYKFDYIPKFARYLSNTLMAVYTSRTFSYGFEYSTMTTYGYEGASTQLYTELYDSEFSGDPSGLEIKAPTPFLFLSTEMADIYDIESVKLPPPRGKQIRDYLGAIAIVDHEKFYFSDFSTGGTIENFTPFDNFPVGSETRGKITGFFSNETFICVLREEEAYYITGNVFLANYRIQAAKSTRIGLTDPRSVIDFQGAGIFLSKRGFYGCQQGGSMPEISDMIETIFTEDELGLDLDLSNCKAVVDYVNEYIYFHIASNTASNGYVFAFSYYHREWFLLDGINGTGAFEIIDTNLYSSDGVNLFKEDTTRLSADAYYRSNFETLGEASLNKKFLSMLMYTIGMPEDFELGVKTYKNWNTSDVDTEEVKSIASNDTDVKQRLNPARAKSMAFELTSGTGQPLILDGYEYEFSSDSQGTKDDN